MKADDKFIQNLWFLRIFFDDRNEDFSVGNLGYHGLLNKRLQAGNENLLILEKILQLQIFVDGIKHIILTAYGCKVLNCHLIKFPHLRLYILYSVKLSSF